MKWALITGAGGGIGRATALRLAADGFAVFVTDIDETLARETSDLVGKAGREAHWAVLDVTDQAAQRRIV